MTIAFVEVIAAKLVSAGVAGGSTGWTISKLQHRDAERDIAVLDAAGPEPLRQAERYVNNGRFQIQIRGRATGSVQETAMKAEDVMAALDGASMAEFDHIFVQQSGPLNISPDDKGRSLFVVNLRVQEA